MNKLDLVEGSDGVAHEGSKGGTSFGMSCKIGLGVDAFLSALAGRALSLVSDGYAAASPNGLCAAEGTEGVIIT